MFSRLFNLGSSAPSDAEIVKSIRADLARLKEIDASLPAPAIAYVLGESEDESVLAALSALTGRHKELFAWGLTFEIYDLPSKDHDRLTRLVAKRQSAMALLDGFDAARTARYATVLATLCPAPSYTERSELDNLPAGVRLAALYALDCVNFMNSANQTYHDVLATQSAHDRWFDLVDAFGLDRGAAHRLLWAGTEHWNNSQLKTAAEALGRASLLHAETDQVEPLLASLGAAERVAVLQTMTQKLDDPTIQAAAVSMLNDGSKAVRGQALVLVESLPDPVAFEIASDALSGRKATSRAVGAQLMAILLDRNVDGASDELEKTLASEQSKTVIRVIEDALSRAPSNHAAPTDGTAGYEALDGTWIAIPPVVPLAPGKATITKDDRRTLQKTVDRLEKMDAEQYERQRQESKRHKKKYGDHFWDPEPPVKWERGDLDKVCDWFSEPFPLWTEGRQSAPDRLLLAQVSRLLSGGTETVNLLKAIMKTGGPDHEIRLLTCLTAPEKALQNVLNGWRGAEPTATVIDEMRAPGGDVRRLSLGLETPPPLAEVLFGPNTMWYEDQLPPSAIWPAMAERMDLFDAGFGLRAAEPPIGRDIALKRLSQLPAAPARYRSALIEAAVTSPRDRAAALELLGEIDISAKLIDLLNDGRQDVRAGAADLLGRRKIAAAETPLRKRLTKEKSEKVRAAALTALGALGADLSVMLSTDALLKEAQAGLAKAKLEKLDWLRLKTLPKLTLADGSPLPDAVPQWWIALADKLKQPQGNALFDLWLTLLSPKAADDLGRYIVEAWIAQDTNKRTAEDVEAMVADYAKSYPQSASEGQMAYMRQIYRSEYLSSAAAHKGLLGLAVKADAKWIAPLARRYLKDHGKRVSQAKAFLEMLATQGDGPALQVVVSTATRFAQKTVQAHAEELLAKVADARGWTTDQLSDRTVASAGLDASGVLTLDLPGGAYVAHLTDNLTLELRNPQGRTVKSLPAGKDEQTAAARKTLTAARKDLKEVAAQQSDRLKAAMATQRSWTTTDWQRDMMGHPILRTLAGKLVWQSGTSTFRPTPEGDLIDANDADVTLAADGTLSLAHPVSLGTEGTENWRNLLAEDEIIQPIPQLARPALGIPANVMGKKDGTNSNPPVPDGEDTRRGEAVTERRGWLSDANAIEKAARDRGWTRGPVEDAGWYGTLERAFPGADIKAVISFTGGIVGIPETFPAAMETLTFEPLKGGGWNITEVKLDAVPPVVLSEARNDYREIALGAFDPD